MLHLQNTILEMVATGESLEATMHRLCAEVESSLPGVVCSVLRVDQRGTLHPLSAPSLPQSYSAALEGVAIGANVGACGSAAFLGVPVSLTDIATNPHWAAPKDDLARLGLNSCWSSPISDALGRVLGTFAFYFREHRGPTLEERAVVATCVHLCTIALERHERVLERDRLANIDALTGLANRACFNTALSRLSCAAAGGWGIMVVDVDNLKITNDTFGHQAGDELLQAVAVRLACVAGPDRAYRLGGDEFAIIVEAVSALHDIDAFAQTILSKLDDPTPCDGHLIFPQATIGCAILSADDRTAQSVRQKADFALYHAKETGRGGFVRYWPGIGTAITRRLTAIRDVNAALAENRIKAYYQPICRLDTGEVVGAEALCRLIRPDGAVISAAEFNEAMSDAHVACAVTDCMLSQIVRDVRGWLDLGIAFQHVGLNISYADIHRGKLGTVLADAFARGDVPLKHLVVEITEDVYIGRRDHLIAREVKAMRALGLRVALDDFGTGFASLTHLLTVPVDIIKIDKSFVDNLAPETPSSVIVDGLLTIAQKLGIKVVAEGIETSDQAAQLLRFGCQLGQGYLYAKAMPGAAMTELLLRRSQMLPPQRDDRAAGGAEAGKTHSALRRAG